MNVDSICSRNPVTVAATTEVADAARLMRKEHVGFLVVAEPTASNGDLKVSGVLTDRDIVTSVLAKDGDVHNLRVGDIMTRKPLVACVTTSLNVTLRHMREMGIRRVPVIGAREELVGVLSLDDALDAISCELSDLVEAIRGGQRNERATRP